MLVVYIQYTDYPLFILQQRLWIVGCDHAGKCLGKPFHTYNVVFNVSTDNLVHQSIDSIVVTVTVKAA